MKIPISVRATVSASISISIDHALDSTSISDWEKLLSFAPFVLGIPVSTRTEQAYRESLSTLLRKNVKSFYDFNFDVFSNASPEFYNLHPLTSPLRTYQSSVNASVRAKLIEGDISAALQLVVSTDYVASRTVDVMAVLRSMPLPLPWTPEWFHLPTSVLRYVRRPSQFRLPSNPSQEAAAEEYTDSILAISGIS